MIGALVIAAGAASEGRWAYAGLWFFLAGLYAVLILVERKKGR